MSDELKPCWHCNPERGDPYVSQDADRPFGMFVLCGMCGARGPVTETKVNAIAAWNSRPDPPELAELRAKVQELSLNCVHEATMWREAERALEVESKAYARYREASTNAAEQQLAEMNELRADRDRLREACETLFSASACDIDDDPATSEAECWVKLREALKKGGGDRG